VTELKRPGLLTSFGRKRKSPCETTIAYCPSAKEFQYKRSFVPPATSPTPNDAWQAYRIQLTACKGLAEFWYLGKNTPIRYYYWHILKNSYYYYCNIRKLIRRSHGRFGIIVATTAGWLGGPRANGLLPSANDL
jgi:hypothetical protein